MGDENAFLSAIMVQPMRRLAYADWLAERADPRADFVRMDPCLERISYVEWLTRDGHLDYYLQNFPEVHSEADERQTTENERNKRRALATQFDPDWVAFIDTLACPFKPFFFFNNHGNPNECRPEELPFAEPIGSRGKVITLESSFRDEKAWSPAVMNDLRFLSELELTECEYGAATCPVHPFLCELNPPSRPLTGADVLASLKARNFHSKHIPTLNATTIEYPGYNPGDGTRVENDEIHNDFAGQHIFAREKSDTGEPLEESAGIHGELQQSVANGQLWYVLLHTTPQKSDEFLFSNYVVLLAVGQSKRGDRLIGVITHQVCHNLCD